MNSQRVFDWLYWTVLVRLPVRLRVSIHFWRVHRRFPRLRNPQTLSEKIQVRKLRERDERFSPYSDKAGVKEFVTAKLGEAWCVPTYFCGKRLPETMQWPTPFVVKPTHASGLIRFVQSVEDYELAKAESPAWLEEEFGFELGESHYRNIDPQIIVEPDIGSPNCPPWDYKFLVFGGRVEMIEVHIRLKQHNVAYYDRSWNRQNFHTVGYRMDEEVARPAHLDEMIRAAETLGAGFSFVRVDFYDLEDGPKFGEMTFVPGSGYIRFAPIEADYMLGSLWRQTS